MKISLIFLKFSLFLLCFNVSFSQNTTNDTISSQQVTVIKSYTPSLSNAFKIRTVPKNVSLSVTKKKVEYFIVPAPVVSTFKPDKASPLQLKSHETTPPNNTLLSVGYGNRNQLYFDFSSMVKLHRTQTVGILAYHDSFGSSIPNTPLKSDQNYSSIGFNHAVKKNSLRIDSKLKFETKKDNYYGLPPVALENVSIQNIDPRIRRNYLNLHTNWEWHKKILHRFEFSADVTTDNFKTSEQELNLITQFRIPISESIVDLNVDVNNLNTTFNQGYTIKTQLQKHFLSAGLTLQWGNVQNDLKYKIGAKVSYLLNGEFPGNKSFFYFPEVTISYSPKNALFVPYLRAMGNLKIRGYREFFKINPYVAPVLNIEPTETKCDIRVGVRSNESTPLAFDLNINYQALDNSPFYQKLPLDPKNESGPFRFSNAYQIQYGTLRVLNINTQLGFALGNSNSLRIDLSYIKFQSNLPELRASFRSSFHFFNRLYLSLNIKVIGERNEHFWSAFLPQFDALLQSGTLDQHIEDVGDKVQKLPMFITSSANINYKFLKQWDIFLKAKINNSDIHGQWSYYPENKFLVLAGVTYKFDLQL